MTPDTGGEDVFIHANDLEVDKRLIVPGTTVEFQIDEGDKGLKASHVRLHQSAATPAATTAPRPQPYIADGLSDVLTLAEFLNETTEALLRAAPTMSGQQIVQAREGLAELAQAHGWIESD